MRAGAGPRDRNPDDAVFLTQIKPSGRTSVDTNKKALIKFVTPAQAGVHALKCTGFWRTSLCKNSSLFRFQGSSDHYPTENNRLQRILESRFFDNVLPFEFLHKLVRQNDEFRLIQALPNRIMTLWSAIFHAADIVDLAAAAVVLAKSVLGGLHHEYSVAIAPASA